MAIPRCTVEGLIRLMESRDELINSANAPII
jgi:hypothetical protein